MTVVAGRSPYGVPVWTLIGYGGVTQLLAGMSAPMLPLLLRQLGFPATRSGLLIGVAGLVSAALSVLFGRWADRVDAVRLFGPAAVLLAVTPLGYLWATDAGQVLALRFAEGALGPLAAITSQAILLRLARSDGRTTGILGTARSWRALLFVLGPVLGGAVAAGWSLRGLFLVEALVLGALAAVAVPVLRSPRAPRARSPSARPGRDRTVPALLAILLLDFVNFQALLFLFPLYGARIGLSPGLIGLLVTIEALAYGLAQQPMARLAAARRGALVVGLCSAAGGPLVFLLSWTRSPLLLGGLMVLVGLASGPVFLFVMLRLADVAGARAGAAMGSITSVLYLSSGLAPMLAAALTAFGPDSGFLLPPLVSVPMVGLALVVNSRTQAGAEGGTCAPTE